MQRTITVQNPCIFDFCIFVVVLNDSHDSSRCTQLATAVVSGLCGARAAELITRAHTY